MVIFEVLFGFISGVFGGLGMGGGSVLIPLLTIFLDMNQKMAQGINLLSFLVMSIVSIFIHYKNGYIETKGLFFIILGGLFFSLIGSLVAVNLSSQILRTLFGIFLCALAFGESIKIFKKHKK